MVCNKCEKKSIYSEQCTLAMWPRIIFICILNVVLPSELYLLRVDKSMGVEPSYKVSIDLQMDFLIVKWPHHLEVRRKIRRLKREF